MRLSTGGKTTYVLPAQEGASTGAMAELYLSHEIINETVVDVRDFAEGWESDPTSLLQAALDEVGASSPTPNPTGSAAFAGQVIQLPRGYPMLEAQIEHHWDGIVVRGRGREATQMFLSPDFPADTPAVVIGDSGGTTFSSRWEGMTLNCNGVEESTGFLFTTAQEGSGLYDMRVRDYTKVGIQADGTGETSKAAEVTLDLLELWASPSGSLYAIDALNCSGTIFVARSTLLALGGYAGGIHTAAVRARASFLSAERLHIEGYSDGILADNDGYVRADTIRGGNGPGSDSDHAMVHFGAFTAGGMVNAVNNVNGNCLLVEREDYVVPTGRLNSYEVRTYNVTDPAVFVPASELQAISGSPTRTVMPSGGIEVWSMPHDSVSTVGGFTDKVPGHWAKFEIRPSYASIGTPNGNVRWRPDNRFIGRNDTIAGAGGTGSEVNKIDGVTTNTLHDEGIQTISTNDVRAGKNLHLAVTRRGDDNTNDTSTNAIGLAGIYLVEVL